MDVQPADLAVDLSRPQELAGRVAVVTGSSSGIGQAMALELARAGAAVFLCARRAAPLRRAAAQIRRLGAEAQTAACDLAEDKDQAALVERAWQWRSRVDVWVNNAGADLLTGAAARWPFEKKLETLWQVDVRAAIRLARLTGARMRAAGGGTILNVGWDGAARGMAGDSGQLFAAAKGAVMAFTLSLAQSLAPQVRVNCIAPGWIRTAWGRQTSDYWQQRAERESLRGRWGTPEDVARVARFLASPAADFLTGQILYVNGGFRTEGGGGKAEGGRGKAEGGSGQVESAGD
jgi:3-oxoacyl-[acyl-carrier protein] reductase